MVKPSYSFLHILVIPLCVCLVFIGYRASNSLSADKQKADAVSFIIAHNILEHGVFSGVKLTGQDTTIQSDASTPPFYPFFLASLGAIDSDLKSQFKCYAETGTQCGVGSGFVVILIVQILLTALAAVLLFNIALRLSGSNHVAWASLILVLLTGFFGTVAQEFKPGLFHYLSVYACLLALLMGYQTQYALYSLLAGCALGGAILLHPFYSPLIVVIAALLCFIKDDDEDVIQPVFNRAKAALLFIFAAAITLSPWLFRNYSQLDIIAIAPTYEIAHLAERAAYNMMNFNEWLIIVLRSIPAVGDSLLNAFVAPSELITIKKTWMPLEKAHDSYFAFIQNYGVQDIVGYLFASSALMLQALLSTGGVLSLIGLFFIISLLYILSYRRELKPFLFVFIPLVTIWLLNGFLLPEDTAFNLTLIFVPIYALAYMKGGI